MIPKTKSGTIKMIRHCIHYLENVEIYGGDAEDLSECIRFLRAWLKTLSSKEVKKMIAEKKKKRK